MRRHLIPHAEVGAWQGDGLTIDPDGGVELPKGFGRSLRLASGLPTVTREYDEVRGFVVRVQWLGLIVEIAMGRVR